MYVSIIIDSIPGQYHNVSYFNKMKCLRNYKLWMTVVVIKIVLKNSV